MFFRFVYYYLLLQGTTVRTKICDRSLEAVLTLRKFPFEMQSLSDDGGMTLFLESLFRVSIVVLTNAVHNAWHVVFMPYGKKTL